MQPTRPAIHVMPLPQLPESGKFIDYLNILVTHAIRPGGLRRPSRKSEIARAIGISTKQLGNLLAGRSGLPQRETFEGILRAFFGNDPSYGTEWRVSMAASWRSERVASADDTGHQLEEDRPPHVQPAPPTHPTPKALYFRRLPPHFQDGLAVRPDIASAISVAPFRVALHGPRGVGKTVQATAFAHQHQASYDTIAWIEAESASSCEASLIGLGTKLAWISRETEGQAAVAEVLHRLSTLGALCLLIYDNAKDPQSLFSYLPNGDCHVLITSVNPNWRTEAVPIQLCGWSDEVGAAYFAGVLGMVDRKEAKELTRDLGGNPLAVALAAAYCEHRSLSLGQYRQRLAGSGPGNPLLETQLTAPGYPATIAAALAQSIQSAHADHPCALTVLRMLSILPPEPMPIWLLSELRDCVTRDTTNPLRGIDFEEVVSILRRHSLVSDGLSFTSVGNMVIEFKAIITHKLVSNYLASQHALDETEVVLAASFCLAWFNSKSAETRAADCIENTYMMNNISHLIGLVDQFPNPSPEGVPVLGALREAWTFLLAHQIIRGLQRVADHRMHYAHR